MDEEVPEVQTKCTKKRIDHWYLNNPYWDNEDLFMEKDQESYETFAGDPNDVPRSLEEAKRSSEWTQWEDAIKTELR